MQKNKNEKFLHSLHEFKMSVINNELTSQMVTPPPLSQVTFPVKPSDVEDNQPGEIIVSESGKLLRASLEFNNFSADLIEGFDNLLINILPTRLKNRTIPLKKKSKHGINTEIVIVGITPTLPHIGTSQQSQKLLPMLARNTNRSYMTDVYLTIIERDQETLKQIGAEKRIHAFKIPIMLGSSVCYLNIQKTTAQERLELGEGMKDPLGYFIIGGTEYTLVHIEQLRHNKLFVTYNKDGELYAKFTGDLLGTTSLVQLTFENNVIKTYISFFGRDDRSQPIQINVMSIYRMLGLSDPKDILQLILGFVKPNRRSKIQAELAGTLVDLSNIGDDFLDFKDSLKSNLEYIELEDRLISNLFVQIEPDRIEAKLALLSYMIMRMIQVKLGYTPPDDLDSWSLKKLKTPAKTIEQFLFSKWNLSMKDLTQKIESVANPSLELFAKTISVSSIGRDFEKAFKGNNWATYGRNREKSGTVSQIMIRESLLKTHSTLNKVSVARKETNTKRKLRIVQPTQLGYIDPVETPEGTDVGLTKHKTVTCFVSQYRDPVLVQTHLTDQISEQKTPERASLVFLNGNLLGWSSGLELYQRLVDLKRSYQLPFDTSIVFEAGNVLHIYTDEGRVTRPLLIVEKGELVIETKDLFGQPFEELLREGAVEYIDAWEQEFIQLAQSINDVNNFKSELRVAQKDLDQASRELKELPEGATERERRLLQGRLNRIERVIANIYSRKRHKESRHNMSRDAMEYTHCELDPNAIFGVAASVLPLPDHNMGPRNNYAAGHAKQSLGIYHSNYRTRFDTTAKLLAFPQRPLFENQLNKLIGLDDLPTGQTVMMAIMPYGGYNQEDAVIFNKASIERGLFKIMILKTVKSIQDVKPKKDRGRSFTDRFDRPIPKPDKDPAIYKHIDSRGVPKIGARIQEGYPIIGKVRAYLDDKSTKDVSIYATADEVGIVDHVLYTRNLNNELVIKVAIRQVRNPIVGDKFAAAGAQKSTIGVILDDVDMPYIADSGITPDVIMNPHAIPSRMTVGTLIEIVASKLGALSGEKINASAFNEFNVDTLIENLKQYGFSNRKARGYEDMINGQTGEPITAQIFVGPVYYRALRHLVQDKIQGRGTGPYTIATRQPVAGRSNLGGLRFGEMERDALISHGASKVLRERLMVSSDEYRTVFCATCGLIAIDDPDLGYRCQQCQGKAEFGRCSIPFSYKYLTQLLAQTGMKLSLGFKKPE